MVKLLIDKIKAPATKNEDKFTQIQCFSQIARYVGNKITKEQISEIFPILNGEAKAVGSSGRSNDIDNERAEACLFSIESLVRRAPKELDAFIPQILQLSSILVKFDPNYNYDYANNDVTMQDEEEGAGWGDEIDEEDWGNADDDDTSWKVRRASVKLIDAILNSRPDKLREIYRNYAAELVDRFKERDENVKINILETFRSFLKSSIHSEANKDIALELSSMPSLIKAKSVIDEIYGLVPSIIGGLTKQLRSTKNLKVKIAVMQTFTSLSHVMHMQTAPHFGQFLPDIEKIVNEGAYELVLDSLTVMRRLFKTDKTMFPHFQEHFRAIQQIIIKALSHDYAKVVSEALRVAGVFINVLQPENGQVNAKYTSVIQPIYDGILDKLKKADIDQEIKQSSIISMALFISLTYRNLSEKQISDVIMIFNDRLQNDMTREATLKAIVKITSNPIPIPTLHTLVPRMFELLHKAQRSVNLNTLEALVSMSCHYAKQFEQSTT
jgi:hypothetical protein